jgi:hypothetical protein
MMGDSVNIIAFLLTVLQTAAAGTWAYRQALLNSQAIPLLQRAIPL